MKYLSFILAIFASFIFVSACTHTEKKVPRDIASFQESGVEGIWVLQGTSSTRGPYNGEIELRKSQDGTFAVTRVVTYINYYFDGLKVQEVWTGRAVPAGDSLTISYDLRQADFITKLDKTRREKSDFTNPIVVVSRFQPTDSGLAAAFSDKKVSDYKEWITTKRDLETAPLWQMDRRNVDASTTKLPTVAKDTDFAKDAFLKPFKGRSEFKGQVPYMVVDATDFDFYRSNKDTIRVFNKVTDDISITEAALRRNAYAPTLENKQVGFDENMKEQHLNELGLVANSTLDDRGRLTGFVLEHNAALLTGIYVGSQAMRYLVTKDSEALFHVRRSIKGLRTLIEITGNPKEFARAAALYNPANPIPKGWHKGTGDYASYIWLEGGDKDLLKGINHALIWTAMVVPVAERETWEQLQEQVNKMAQLRAAEEPVNKVTLAGLSMIFNKDKSSVASYKTAAMQMGKTSSENGEANLQMISDITDILLNEELDEFDLRDRARERLVDHWVHAQGGYRHLLTMVTQAFATQHGVRGPAFKQLSSDEKFKKSLELAKWSLREIPYPRPNLDVEVNHSYRADWCVSPHPKPGSKRQVASERYQGIFSYPIFEMQALGSDYLWSEASYDFKLTHKKGAEGPGVDYLYAYWLGRYGNVIGTSINE